MEGYGLSVFSGTAIDTFRVRVLGVQGQTRAGGSTIMVELLDPRLELGAIPQGMSGSPVFIDDRLAGAVAFSWEGALRPICGLTPAAEIFALPAFAVDAAAAASGRDVGGDPRALLDPAGLGAALAARVFPQTAPQRPRDPAVTASPGAAAAWLGDLERSGTAWPTPDELAARLLLRATGRDRLVGGGLSPLPAGIVCRPVGGVVQASDATHLPASPLAPGAACAVPLVLGDAEIGALGSVTWVEGDAVYLFGHPLLQAGPIELPLATAEVLGDFPSRQMSFRIGSIGAVVGATRHDLRAGVTGRLGPAPSLAPVHVTVSRPDDPGATVPEEYRFEVASDPRLTASLVFWCLYNALLVRGDDVSQQTISYEIESRWRREVQPAAPSVGGAAGDAPPEEAIAFSGLLAGPSAASALGPEWLAPIQLLVENRHARLTLMGVAARLVVTRGARSAIITGADAPATIRAGQPLPVAVTLKSRRGESRVVRHTLQLPRELAPGTYRLLVASGRDAFALETERAAERFTDRSLAATLEIIRAPRSTADLELVLFAPPGGVLVDGRELARLPGSVAAVLRSNEGGRVASTRADVIVRERLPGEQALRGAAVLDLTVLPPRISTREVSRQ